MAFPSTISNFSYPQPTDRLNNPSHSGLERAQSSAITQLETFIGTSSSAVGTLMYDVRSPLSDGGGHIQTAVKGGTGQFTFTKGDILVATGPSVLSKLAVSSTLGDALVADPGQATGMRWGNTVANKVAVVTTTASIYSSNTEQVLFAASILGSALGINNAVRFTGTMRYGNNQTVFTIRGKYGNNDIFSIAVPATNDTVSSAIGRITGLLVGNSTNSSQKSFADFLAENPGAESAAQANVGWTKSGGMAQGTSSVESSATQNLIITGQFAASSANSSILTHLFVVEKIQ